MKQDGDIQELVEKTWRRRLTESERKGAVTAGADPADLLVESRLTSALGRLPEPAVSSNFTSQVLKAVELENAAAARSQRGSAQGRIWRWLPRFALGCLLLGAGLFSYERVEARRSVEMARSLAIISAPALSPEVLEDFDAIQVMSRTPPADEQLLALMQ